MGRYDQELGQSPIAPAERKVTPTAPQTPEAVPQTTNTTANNIKSTRKGKGWGAIEYGSIAAAGGLTFVTFAGVPYINRLRAPEVTVKPGELEGGTTKLRVNIEGFRTDAEQSEHERAQNEQKSLWQQAKDKIKGTPNVGPGGKVKVEVDAPVTSSKEVAPVSQEIKVQPIQASKEQATKEDPKVVFEVIQKTTGKQAPTSKEIMDLTVADKQILLNNLKGNGQGKTSFADSLTFSVNQADKQEASNRIDYDLKALTKGLQSNQGPQPKS
jgi:hypothetical protein